MKGMTVLLHVKTQTGVDTLNNPTYSESVVEVPNVLVGQPTTDDVTSSVSLFGKKLEYMLGIPKGDAHDWQDRKVSWTMPNGATMICQTLGFPIFGVEANIPGPWHMKVRCAAYGS